MQSHTWRPITGGPQICLSPCGRSRFDAVYKERHDILSLSALAFAGGGRKQWVQLWRSRRGSWRRAVRTRGLPHHRNPKELVSLDHLADLGALYWQLNPNDYENDQELQKIRESRGYSYMDLLDLCPEKVENYEQKLKNFYTEHIHGDEEIRYCLEGSGYFDVRDKADRCIRIWIRAGDLSFLPAGIYHRFTLDTDNYIKIVCWGTGVDFLQRPQEEHPARKEYIKSFTEKSGVPLEAH